MCLVPSNPDVSGIGVRIAIYLQVFLGYIFAIYFLCRKPVLEFELGLMRDQCLAALVTALGLIIACVIQAATQDLSSYHVAIALSLSFLTHGNVVAYVVLRMRVIQSLRESGQVNPRPERTIAPSDIEGHRSLDGEHHNLEKHSNSLTPRTDPNQALRPDSRLRILSPLDPMVLIAFGNLAYMGSLGIWLWHEPRSFGIAESRCAVDLIYLSYAGARVRFGSHGLRVFYLFAYSAMIVPPFAWMLYPVYLYLKFQRTGEFRPTPLKGLSVLPAFIIVVVALIFSCFLVYDIEAALRWNRELQDSQENVWGFGQILAILLVLLPLRIPLWGRRNLELWKEAIRSGDVDGILRIAWGGVLPGPMVDTWVLNPTILQVQTEDGLTALEVVTRAKRWDAVRSFVIANADINKLFKGSEDNIKTLLHAACHYDQKDLISILLEKGADPNIIRPYDPKRSSGTGTQYGLPLHYACSQAGQGDDIKLIKQLLECGADPSLPALWVSSAAGRYGTAHDLARETHGDNSEIVQVLRRRTVAKTSVLPSSQVDDGREGNLVEQGGR